VRITPRNIIRHELIGLNAEVVASPHPGYVGIAGRVMDESAKMLYIESGREVKAVPKAAATFRFKLPSGEHVEVEGWVIEGRPEDRVKRAAKAMRRDS
jgi:ribonuclease P protein subunit POP4